MRNKTRYKFSAVPLFLCMIFLVTSLSLSVNAQETENETQYRQISMEDYADKVAGGWVGQAIAVLWAQWTEFNWRGDIVPFDLEDWYMLDPSLQGKRKALKYSQEKLEFYRIINDKSNWIKWKPDTMPDQDDLYVEFMFLYSIRKHGLDVTDKQIAEDWSEIMLHRMAGANRAALQNFRKGIWPPWSGHPRYSPMGNAIDFQIEADLFGIISPGMPRVSNAWSDKVGHIMNYGDGVYGGMAMAAMYSEAFFESDPVKLVDFSLQAIPAESDYAKMIRDVKELHQKYPDWQDAWQELEEKWGKKDGEMVHGLDVRINGAYVYMGLLYGEGDFWKTMNISMRCGRDSDCNPSSCAGILGTVMGMQGIPKKWAVLRDLPIRNTRVSNVAYPGVIDWDDIIDETVEVGKWNVLENGGYLEKGILNIPHKAPISPPLEQTEWGE